MTSSCGDRKESYRLVAQHLLTRASACVGESVYVRHFLVLKASRLPRACTRTGRMARWQSHRLVASTTNSMQVHTREQPGLRCRATWIHHVGSERIDCFVTTSRQTSQGPVAGPGFSPHPSRERGGEPAAEEPLLELSSALPRSG